MTHNGKDETLKNNEWMPPVASEDHFLSLFLITYATE